MLNNAQKPQLYKTDLRKLFFLKNNKKSGSSKVEIIVAV